MSNEVDYILIICKAELECKEMGTYSVSKLCFVLKEYLYNKGAIFIVFISRNDRFSNNEFAERIDEFIKKDESQIALLLPYLRPPDDNERTDGEVGSFIISANLFLRFNFSLSDFPKIAYYIVYEYLDYTENSGLEIIQVGKPLTEPFFSERDLRRDLDNSSILIPHKGPLRLLNRCLFHLDRIEYLPQNIDLSFDDRSWLKFELDNFPALSKVLSVYKNCPYNVGPFVSRDFLIRRSNREYVFHMDSDDVAIKSRFSNQIAEMKKRNLDMLGSHELRIDEYKKSLFIIRFPLDVNSALKHLTFHPLLHSTSVIKKSSFLKVGGYSTNGKFGYDSQFLLRASFFLKIGNIDEFLYIRYKRPYSLTTSKKTKIGSKLRTFMAWRWLVDFNLIIEGKLPLGNSSLGVVNENIHFKPQKIFPKKERNFNSRWL